MNFYSIEERVIVSEEHFNSGEKIKNSFRTLCRDFGRNKRTIKTTIGFMVTKFFATCYAGNTKKVF